MYSVESSGREFACDGEDVVFRCEVFQRSGLQWVAPPLISSAVPIAFGTSARAPAVSTLGGFYAVLTAFRQDTFPNANFTSTLQVQASSMMNDTDVECRSPDQQISEQIRLALSGKLLPSTMLRRYAMIMNFPNPKTLKLQVTEGLKGWACNRFQPCQCYIYLAIWPAIRQ